MFDPDTDHPAAAGIRGMRADMAVTPDVEAVLESDRTRAAQSA